MEDDDVSDVKREAYHNYVVQQQPGYHVGYCAGCTKSFLYRQHRKYCSRRCRTVAAPSKSADRYRRTIRQRAHPRLIRSMRGGGAALSTLAFLARYAPDLALAEAKSLDELATALLLVVPRAKNFGDNKLLPATCATCGLAFVAERATARFCSNACRQASYRARHTTTPPRASWSNSRLV
jgi:endogenous inhibitor of DNA gyrase (YacG/DUF329 family)